MLASPSAWMSQMCSNGRKLHEGWRQSYWFFSGRAGEPVNASKQFLRGRLCLRSSFEGRMLPTIFSSAPSEKAVKQEPQHNQREDHILPIALIKKGENRKCDPANRCGDENQ